MDRLTIVGDRRGLAIAVRNEAFRERRTSLARRIREACGEEEGGLFPAKNTTFRQDAPQGA